MDDTTEASLVYLCRTALSRAGLPATVEHLLDFPDTVLPGQFWAASFTTSRDEFLQWNRSQVQVALGVQRQSLQALSTYWSSLSDITYLPEAEIIETATRYIKQQFDFWFHRLSRPFGPSFSVDDAPIENLAQVAGGITNEIQRYVGVVAATQKLEVFRDEKEVRFLQRLPRSDEASTTQREDVRMAGETLSGASRHLTLELDSGLAEVMLKQGGGLGERHAWWGEFMVGASSDAKLTTSRIPFRR